jgi:hypothetical protein
MPGPAQTPDPTRSECGDRFSSAAGHHSGVVDALPRVPCVTVWACRNWSVYRRAVSGRVARLVVPPGSPSRRSPPRPRVVRSTSPGGSHLDPGDAQDVVNQSEQVLARLDMMDTQFLLLGVQATDRQQLTEAQHSGFRAGFRSSWAHDHAKVVAELGERGKGREASCYYRPSWAGDRLVAPRTVCRSASPVLDVDDDSLTGIWRLTTAFTALKHDIHCCAT